MYIENTYFKENIANWKTDIYRLAFLKVFQILSEIIYFYLHIN